MDLRALIERVREHYVGQFEAFVDAMERDASQGRAEVKFLIPEPTSLYRRFVCVDYVKNDSGAEALFFDPEHTLQFEPFSGSFGGTRLIVEAMRWDNVELHHTPQIEIQLDNWFERWFDPDDRRHDPGAKLGLIIHSLSIEPGVLSIDFGTAPGEALWDLLQGMAHAGVTEILINGGERRRH